ncbi:MAG: aminopeptidase P family N-terminal domain-containing protein [Acidimicrobiia bacterium]|nr:aminopeptidase P family N-terminal domain-containing protein [Acidimicrobiia bacterium]
MSSERGLPVEEFSERTRRCQAQMAERQIAAVLVCTEPEVRYFTGFHIPFWQSPTRPWFMVVPSAGKPISVIPSISEATTSDTWIDDVCTWSSSCPDDDGVTLLADALQRSPRRARSACRRGPRPMSACPCATSTGCGRWWAALSTRPTSSAACAWSRASARSRSMSSSIGGCV